eukprot:768560-Hanusia_phi.AAC.2
MARWDTSLLISFCLAPFESVYSSQHLLSALPASPLLSLPPLVSALPSFYLLYLHAELAVSFAFRHGPLGDQSPDWSAVGMSGDDGQSDRTRPGGAVTARLPR